MCGDGLQEMIALSHRQRRRRARLTRIPEIYLDFAPFMGEVRHRSHVLFAWINDMTDAVYPPRVAA
jgi:hypothetical protein